MNCVSLVGNLTKDVELRATTNGTAVCQFTVAVQRRFKNHAGEYDADFVNCVAWRGTAEFITRYFQKGSKIGVTGNIRTDKYEDRDGKTRYKTEVFVDNAEFVERKSAEAKPAEQEQTDLSELGLTDIDDGELPWES